MINLLENSGRDKPTPSQVNALLFQLSSSPPLGERAKREMVNRLDMALNQDTGRSVELYAGLVELAPDVALKHAPALLEKADRYKITKFLTLTCDASRNQSIPKAVMDSVHNLWERYDNPEIADQALNVPGIKASLLVLQGLGEEGNPGDFNKAVETLLEKQPSALYIAAVHYLKKMDFLPKSGTMTREDFLRTVANNLKERSQLMSLEKLQEEFGTEFPALFK